MLSHLMARAKTKDGESIPKDKSHNDISACSFYYMLDKDSWQLKIWLYPTNRSKTYSIPIKDNQITLWSKAIKSINTFSFDIFACSECDDDNISDYKTTNEEDFIL